MRASVADEATVSRLGRSSSVIIDEAGTTATRLRAIKEGAGLALAETGPIRLHSPQAGQAELDALRRRSAREDEIKVKIGLDLWNGQANRSQDTTSEDADDATACLNRLDGWTHTQLTLIDPEGDMVMIGGGPDRFLVQYLLPEDGGEWIAVADPDLEGETELAIGRQKAPYPSRQLVGSDQAVAAVTSLLRRRIAQPAGRLGAVVLEKLADRASGLIRAW